MNNGRTIIMVLLLLSIHPLSVLAYRPFDSTDADVVDKGEIELELGLFNASYYTGIEKIHVPALIFNYGLTNKLELVSEFDVQVYSEGPERNFELMDPAVFLKSVIKDGVLQGRKGISFAVEAGVLLPSSPEEERNFGLEGIGILSGTLPSLVYHVNAGVELERENFDTVGIWGAILEHHARESFRLVGELNGSFKSHAATEYSCLAGFVWEVHDIGIDLGLRKSLSDDPSGWDLTTGCTLKF